MGHDDKDKDVRQETPLEAYTRMHVPPRAPDMRPLKPGETYYRRSLEVFPAAEPHHPLCGSIMRGSTCTCRLAERTADGRRPMDVPDEGKLVRDQRLAQHAANIERKKKV